MAVGSRQALEDINESVAAIFDQAQASLANHRKNCVALHKLHQKTVVITQPAKNGTAVRLVGEKAFGDAFIDMANRVLVIKKGPVTADRVVKFVGAYVKYMNEKGLADKAKAAETASGSASAHANEEEDSTMITRFISRLLKWLSPGFVAKNKVVRYRSVFLVSEMISHLGEIDEDVYNILRDNLIERLGDRESLIRAHAVIALSKLIGSEDPSELEEGEKTILEILLDVVCYDTAPEVRRAALLNIPLTPISLETILSRTRDTDTLIRRLVFAAVIQTKLGHPKQLSVAHREQIVRDGLGDREPVVRVAAGKMVASWYDAIMGEEDEPNEDTWVGDDGGVMKGLVKFLSLFDVVGVTQIIAVDAITSIFVTRPDLPQVFSFSDAFWKELSPESAVLARVFVEDCIESHNEARLESASLPVVTAFAFYIQEAYNALLELLQDLENARFLNGGDVPDDEESEKRDEDIAKREVVLGELLRIALRLDYMDEIGRRKVFSVVKDMLAHPELPTGLIERCLDILKVILPSERELIRVVVEIVIELREDNGDPPEDPDSAEIDDSRSDITSTRKDRSLRKEKQTELTPEQKAQADLVDQRCLTLCIGMLERVDGSFEDNSTLEGILADLIIPSVKRKEFAMREKGLISLGLCCLIAKNMALNSFQLFLSQVQNAPEGLKLRVLQIIFDLLIMYEQEFFGRSEDVANRITTFLLQTLESDESDAVQAVLSVGICKLLLSGTVTDPKVLTSLVLVYVSIATAHNQELRQCLSYFFPVYCYSSPENQARIQSIFIRTFDLVTQAREELEEDQTMITPYQFGLLLVDWTDPQKSADVALAERKAVHVDLAIDILGALYDSDRPLDDQKSFCQLLSHLHIPASIDQRSLLKLQILLENHDEQCPFDDLATRKSFDRFKNSFSKRFSRELQDINPGDHVDNEFKELYEFIGVDLPTSFDDVAQASLPNSRSPDPPAAERSDKTPDQSDLEQEAVTPIKQKQNRKRIRTPGSGRTPSSSNRKRNRLGGKARPQSPGSLQDGDSEGATGSESNDSPIKTPEILQPRRDTASRIPRHISLGEENDDDDDDET